MFFERITKGQTWLTHPKYQMYSTVRKLQLFFNKTIMIYNETM